MDIFERQDVDVICSGNHELYKRASVDFEFNTTVPHFEQHYLASNLDYINAETQERKPLAHRFRKFTTKNQGIRVLAMGFLFDFSNAADNIVVQDVEDAIKEKWFRDAIRDRDVDLFLIAGHVPLRSPEFQAIYKAIREQQWDTPIQFFGGHTHIRDYVKYDKNAYALESGRYMETVGFMSIDGLNAGGKNLKNDFVSMLSSALSSVAPRTKMARTPNFSRRYVDNNLYSFHHHTGLNASEFPTSYGLNVSKSIQEARKRLRLDHTYGCVPQTYWTNRAPYPSNSSIFSLLQDRILPDKLAREDRKDVPSIAISNTGAIRFDMFEGRFTIDSMYTVSPFTSGFRSVKDVPWRIAQLLLKILNQEVPQLWPVELAAEMKSIAPVREGLLATSDHEHEREQHVKLYATSGKDQHPIFQSRGDSNKKLIPGYTTHDAAGSDGDDTVHSPIKFYDVPNCIQSNLRFPQEGDKDPETVDVIFNDFLQKYILLALKFLGTDYDEKSTESYADGKTLTTMLGEWVSETWKCEDDH